MLLIEEVLTKLLNSIQSYQKDHANRILNYKSSGPIENFEPQYAIAKIFEVNKPSSQKTRTSQAVLDAVNQVSSAEDEQLKKQQDEQMFELFKNSLVEIETISKELGKEAAQFEQTKQTFDEKISKHEATKATLDKKQATLIKTRAEIDKKKSAKETVSKEEEEQYTANITQLQQEQGQWQTTNEALEQEKKTLEDTKAALSEKTLTNQSKVLGLRPLALKFSSKLSAEQALIFDIDQTTDNLAKLSVSKGTKQRLNDRILKAITTKRKVGQDVDQIHTRTHKPFTEILQTSYVEMKDQLDEMCTRKSITREELTEFKLLILERFRHMLECIVNIAKQELKLRQDKQKNAGDTMETMPASIIDPNESVDHFLIEQVDTLYQESMDLINYVSEKALYDLFFSAKSTPEPSLTEGFLFTTQLVANEFYKENNGLQIAGKQVNKDVTPEEYGLRTVPRNCQRIYGDYCYKSLVKSTLQKAIANYSLNSWGNLFKHWYTKWELSTTTADELLLYYKGSKETTGDYKSKVTNYNQPLGSRKRAVFKELLKSMFEASPDSSDYYESQKQKIEQCKIPTVCDLKGSGFLTWFGETVKQSVKGERTEMHDAFDEMVKTITETQRADPDCESAKRHSLGAAYS